MSGVAAADPPPATWGVADCACGVTEAVSLGDCVGVVVGTADGDRAMFRATDLDESAAQWLHRSFADDGEEVVPARFLPAELPLVRVVDRDVELRERLYADDADARTATRDKVFDCRP